MAHGTVTLVNPVTEEIKTVPTGYSWTVLFWGCFPALFRQDWKNFGILAATLLISGMFGIAIIPLIIFSFMYNDKMCLKDLLNTGWKIKGYIGTKSLDHVSSSVGFRLDKFMM